MSERRMQGKRTDEEEGDRRKIPRFTYSELNESLKQSRIWLRVLYSISIFISISEMTWALHKGIENVTQGMLFGAIFLILAILIWRSLFLTRIFLENHSKTNLKRIHEQYTTLFAYISIVSAIFYIISFAYRS